MDEITQLENKKLYHFVYKTIRINTPFYYYGVHSTNNLNDGYLGSGYHLLNAIRKYGKENFSREIIKFFDTHDLALKYENKILTKELLDDKYCYNILQGGRGSKEQHTKSTRQKISIAMMGNKNGEGNRGNCGYKRPDYIKLKISNTLKTSDMGKYNRGRQQSESEKMKRSKSLKLAYKEGRHPILHNYGEKNSFYGKHHTENTKHKLSIITKQRFNNKDERLKISIATKEGMKKSEKWNNYINNLKIGYISSPMKGKKNPNLGKSLKYVMHIRWHIKRNIVKEGCEYCVPEKY